MSADVVLHPGESQESLLRRFQKIVQTSGILKEFKVHQRFMTKRDAYLLKAKNNARRNKRKNRGS
ncbi:MAG: 30S ribosomal protein S21 [Dehalococcoidales bacterium]|jgi:ribosomal protein S21